VDDQGGSGQEHRHLRIKWPDGITTINLDDPISPFFSFLFLRRSCRLKGQEPGGLALYAGEGDYRAPALSDCRLILYKARPEICGRGNCICWKLFIFSSPRTRASRLLRYRSRTHVQMVRSNSSLVEHKIVTGCGNTRSLPRRHMMLQQVLPAENMEERYAHGRAIRVGYPICIRRGCVCCSRETGWRR